MSSRRVAGNGLVTAGGSSTGGGSWIAGSGGVGSATAATLGAGCAQHEPRTIAASAADKDERMASRLAPPRWP